jgi:hypothetical protein
MTQQDGRAGTTEVNDGQQDNVDNDRSAASTPVKPDPLPARMLMTASYNEIQTPPPRPIPAPGEGATPYLSFGVLTLFRSMFFTADVVTGPFEQVM